MKTEMKKNAETKHYEKLLKAFLKLSSTDPAYEAAWAEVREAEDAAYDADKAEFIAKRTSKETA